jgi:hypothetical protein
VTVPSSTGLPARAWGETVHPLPTGAPLELTRIAGRAFDLSVYMEREKTAGILVLQDGKVRLETPTGPAHAEMKAGVPYFRHAGVEHDVINANDTEYAFIEIELK